MYRLNLRRQDLNIPPPRATVLNFKCEQNRLPSHQSWDQGTRLGPIMKMTTSSKADKTNLQAKCRASSPMQGSHWGDQEKQPHPSWTRTRPRPLGRPGPRVLGRPCRGWISTFIGLTCSQEPRNLSLGARAPRGCPQPRAGTPATSGPQTLEEGRRTFSVNSVGSSAFHSWSQTHLPGSPDVTG